MVFNTKLADRLREYLTVIPGIRIEEKKMFRGLAFMVNGKMCVNVSGDNLMCRFDPALQEEVANRNGFEPMIMKGRELTGYCYVSPEGFKTKKEFDYWVQLCLDFNGRAKASAKSKSLSKSTPAKPSKPALKTAPAAKPKSAHKKVAGKK